MHYELLTEVPDMDTNFSRAPLGSYHTMMKQWNATLCIYVKVVHVYFATACMDTLDLGVNHSKILFYPC